MICKGCAGSAPRKDEKYIYPYHLPVVTHENAFFCAAKTWMNRIANNQEGNYRHLIITPQNPNFSNVSL